MTTYALGLDERQHAVAVKALVNPAIDPWLLFDYDEVPGANWNQGQGATPQVEPDMWMQLTVERRPNPLLRAVAATSATGWRITVRGVGRTVDEARWLMWKSAEALNEARLTVGDATSTRIQLESVNAADWDDGRYSALAVWNYTL